jgi:hypothetical protein
MSMNFIFIPRDADEWLVVAPHIDPLGGAEPLRHG